MIKVIAVDDEPLALQQLMVYISKTPFLELVGSCSGAKKALEILEQTGADALFLDINMPGMSGMELARTLSSSGRTRNPLTVFTTAYQEFAIDGYKVDAVDYLLKPFSLEEFTQAALRLKTRFELRQKAGGAVASDFDDTMFFKTGYKIVRIKASDIVYIESMGEYMKIHHQSGGRMAVTLVLQTMNGMLDLLPGGRFMRVHRSYIISLSKVIGAENKSISLTDGSSIPIGDSYRQQAKDWLQKTINQ